MMTTTSSTAIDNLAKLPAGLWALIIIVLLALIGGISWGCYKMQKGDKPTEEEPREAEETP